MKTGKPRLRLFALVGLLVSILPVALAIYFQHRDGLVPCHLCLFQRASFLSAGFVFLILLIHAPSSSKIKWGYSATALLCSISGIASAGRQVWLQHLPADQVPSCGAPLDMMLEMLPLFEVVARVFRGTGECAVVDWTMLGFSMASWSLALLVLLSALALALPRVRD